MQTVQAQCGQTHFEVTIDFNQKTKNGEVLRAQDMCTLFGE